MTRVHHPSSAGAELRRAASVLRCHRASAGSCCMFVFAHDFMHVVARFHSFLAAFFAAKNALQLPAPAARSAPAACVDSLQNGYVSDSDIRLVVIV
jgi:hypothetical protein